MQCMREYNQHDLQHPCSAGSQAAAGKHARMRALHYVARAAATHHAQLLALAGQHRARDLAAAAVQHTDARVRQPAARWQHYHAASHQLHRLKPQLGGQLRREAGICACGRQGVKHLCSACLGCAYVRMHA